MLQDEFLTFHLSHGDHRAYLKRVSAEPNVFQHIQVTQINEKRWFSSSIMQINEKLSASC